VSHPLFSRYSRIRAIISANSIETAECGLEFIDRRLLSPSNRMVRDCTWSKRDINDSTRLKCWSKTEMSAKD